jgi:hypothetical protein
MADVLANLKTGNMEEVPDVNAALQAGTHGIPLYSPQGEGRIANNMNEASDLMSQGWTQPSPQQLQGGLQHAKVNTTGEKIGSFLEGSGEGAGAVYTGVPLFTAAEAGAGKLFGIKELSPEYIALRHKYNQAEEIAGNVVGAGAATYFGGEATLPYTLPKMAEASLAKAFGSQLAPLGSLAVKGMVQSALFSGNQELGKFMYDPSQTAEKAVSNLTLNTALGGIAGAAIGSIPAMWDRTSEAINTSKFMQGLKEQANVTPSNGNIPDELSKAGINASAAVKARASQSGILRRMAQGVDDEGMADFSTQAKVESARALGVDPETLPAVQEAGDSEIASPVRQAIAGKGRALYNAQAQAWDQADAPLKGAIVPPEAKAAHMDAVAGVQGQYAKLKATAPEWNLIEKAKGDLPNLQTLQDFQDWRSGVLDSLWNPQRPQAYWQMKDALGTWEDSFKEGALGAMDPQNVQMLQQARKASTDMYQFMRGASTAMKMGKPDGHPSAWLENLENPLKLTDGQLLSKTAPADNDAYLDWVQKNVPEAAPALQNAYRQKAIQASMTGGELNPQKLWNYVQKNWSPATQNFVFPKDIPGKLTVHGQTYDSVQDFLAQTQHVPGPNEIDPVGGLMLRNLPNGDTVSIPAELVDPTFKPGPIGQMLRQKGAAVGDIIPGVQLEKIDGLQKMAAIQDLLGAVNRKTAGGFGQSVANALVSKMLDSMAGGTGAVIGHTVGGPAGSVVGYGIGKLGAMMGSKAIDSAKLSLLQYLQNGVIDVPAFKSMTDYFDNAIAAHAAMSQGVASIISGKPDVPKQAQIDQKGAIKLGILMDKFSKDQSQMFGIGGNLGTYLPDHQVAVAGLAARAHEYLQAIRPQTDPLGPLDSDKVPSKADQAKYERALNLVNKPLSILSHIKNGNITQDDMGAMELYPGLKNQLDQHFLEAITEAKAKGKTIPYKTRLALSQFMGMNLDSTIGPMTMMTLMQTQAKPPMGPQGGPKGPGKSGKKPPQAAFSRMQEGANSDMTMAQKAERDRVTPQ